MHFATLALATALSFAPSLSRLQPGFQPLASEFEASAGKVRLVVLLSPT